MTAGRPKIPKKKRRQALCALVDPATIEKLAALSIRHKISKGKVIDIACDTLNKGENK